VGPRAGLDDLALVPVSKLSSHRLPGLPVTLHIPVLQFHAVFGTCLHPFYLHGLSISS